MKGLSSSASPSCKNAVVKNASKKLKKRMLAASHPQGEGCASRVESLPARSQDAIGAFSVRKTVANVDKLRTNHHPRSEMTAEGSAEGKRRWRGGLSCRRPRPSMAHLAGLATGR